MLISVPKFKSNRVLNLKIKPAGISGFAVVFVVFVFNSFLLKISLGQSINQQHPAPIVHKVSSVRQLGNHEANEFPLRIGYTQNTELSTKSNSGWYFLAGEKLYQWKLLINNGSQSPLVFYFDKDLKAANANFVVELSNGNKKQFQEITVSDSLPLTYGPVYGDQFVFELTVEDTNAVYLALDEIGVLYKDAFGFGTSGDCEVNVNCEEGASLVNQKQGVARVLVKKGSGLFYCSGSLINNTRRDFAPLFLTANHCGQNATEADYAQWIFAFNYEAEGCENPETAPVYQTLTGARLLAQSEDDVSVDSDFKLLSLLQDVPQHYRPFFNGWNRENVATASGHAIHHPDGDIKKISSYTETPLSTAYQGGSENPDAPYWRVVWAETENGHGVTEGGSSGSPLFDDNELIIGTLTGGLASCDSPLTPDYFGKFSFSWNKNGTLANEQLAPWLDPEQTGVMRLSGMGYDPEVLTAYFMSQHRNIIVGQEVGFTNLSSGNILDYEWFFEGGQPEQSTQKDPGMITFPRSGNFDVRLVVSNESVSDTLILEDYIEVSGSIYPNPVSSSFTLDFGKEFPENPQLILFDLRGREIDISTVKADNKLVISPINHQIGIHFLHVITEDQTEMHKVLLIK